MTKGYNKIKLPEDWKWVKLKEISESIQYGYTESSSKDVIGPKFLRITDIQENKVEWDEVPYCKIDNETKKKYLLANGDLVFARTGATVGKSFLIKGAIPEAVFASYLIRVRVNAEINEGFLSNFFHSTIYWSQITEGQVGIGQPNVNGTKLGQLDLPLPPKKIQHAIVSKIEELFSELDKGIENLHAAQQQLKTYRQSVLKWAFEGKLTNENVNVKDGELPKGWKKIVLGDVCKNVEYGSATKSKIEGKVPVLRMGNIQNGKFDWEDLVYTNDDEEIKKYLLKKDDVLFNRTNSAEWVGKTAIYKGERPAIFAGYLIRINRIGDLLDANFITYFLNSLDAKKYGNSVRSFGVNQSNINGTKLKSYPLSLPPLKEQEKIVEEIESRLSVADKMEESITQSLQQAEALRQSILKKAFEGELL
jgi:type I restriction enzyme S subunit